MVEKPLAIQWLGLHTSTTVGMGLIPGWEAKIPDALQCGLKKKHKNPKKPEMMG